MKRPFLFGTKLEADGFHPAFSGDFWRVFLDDCQLGGKRELAVYSSDQPDPTVQKSQNKVTWYYPSLLAEDGSEHRIALTLTATLEDGVWQYAATMENAGRVRLNELQFPLFSMDRVNGDFDRDILFVPNGLGQKIVNPHRETAECHTEYTAADYKNIMKMYAYPFPLSMPWMVLTSGGMSFYLGYHSSDWLKCSFITMVEPREAKKETFALGISSYPAVRPGESLTYSGMTAALFDGDWREGARFYRRWAESNWMTPRHAKNAVSEMNGWQRIIMKHQFGEIYHTYADLPRLYREGAKYGIHTILLFAWWKEGMDNGYPDYSPSEELGGADALRAAIAEINEMGGRVILYSNGHIIDRSTPYYKNEGWRYTMKDIECNEYIEKYQFSNSGTLLKMGHKTFAAGCYGTQQWADKVLEMEDKQLSLGSNGIFFDQLCACFYLCFDSGHSHGNRIDQDPLLRLRAVKKMKERLTEDQWFGTECFGDRLNWEMDFIHGCGTGARYLPGNYPYLFRYTFPECVISNRFIHDEKEGWEKHLNYAFVHGLIFDVSIYRGRAKSLEVAPAYVRRVSELIALRKQYSDFFTKGSFDTLDLPESVWGAEYSYGGKSVAAVWNDSGETVRIGSNAVENGEVKVFYI